MPYLPTISDWSFTFLFNNTQSLSASATLGAAAVAAAVAEMHQLTPSSRLVHKGWMSSLYGLPAQLVYRGVFRRVSISLDSHCTGF